MLLPNFHILGIQGSGKGTQSALLERRFGLTYVSSGNLFRKRAALGGPLGQRISEQLAKGSLLPDQLLAETIEDFLKDNPVSTGFLGDGVMRTIHQRSLLDPLWQPAGLQQPYLIHLQLSEAVALERIEHRRQEALAEERADHYRKYGGKILQRTDDNPRAIQERLALFHAMTEPLIADYKDKGAYFGVDAHQSIEDISEQIVSHIHQHFPTLVDHESD
jgi:adenylate kinase